ncbi:o-succinylbenzoate synthase [Cesiribacter sp. SM1]|uniref:o-succinylbenzoate synthase n=1 Tax=Cesiribacter sp. SM1 TaxID=2861196 RepID=UPI001CD60C1D|nr:o-succinylbenzoate synthase [Cesiribacter sp. SM1]
MQISAKVRKHKLQFYFSAGTSRGVLHFKDSWFIRVDANGTSGIGEAGPLAGLSPEGTDLDQYWPQVLKNLESKPMPQNQEEAYRLAELAAEGVASIRFALETAYLDWLGGGEKILFRNSFSAGNSSIPINGLIWMADRATMKERIDDKMQEGYRCLKLKIGAIDFREELSLLEYIRSQYGAEELVIRVDANGAFSPSEAQSKLEQLAAWDLHSIEQPIRQGQYAAMQSLCKSSPVPVALDEELIGITAFQKKQELLDILRPPYIILKPSLLGGLAATREWIQLAEERNIGWWITSALESNIGLNAIAQFTAQYAPDLPQGLGTGKLYTNNLPAPLEVERGYLSYRQERGWDLSLLAW